MTIFADLALVQELRIQSRDLHGEILAQLLDLGALLKARADLKVHKHRDTAAHVDVGHAHALVVAGESAYLDVLADDQDLVVLLLKHGLLAAGVLAGEQGVQIGGRVLRNDLGHVLDVLDEEVVLRDEVALGIDFDYGAHAALGADVSVSHALSGYAAGLLLGGGEALLTEPLNGLVDVAVGLGEGLLAVHHADTGHLAQVLDVSSCESHILSSFRII